MKKQVITGSAAWAKWKRQGSRAWKGVMASGPAWAYSHLGKQLIHKGGKP